MIEMETTSDELKELSRIGKIMLRKAAGRRDYFSATWINAKGIEHRIIKRISVYVYILWDAFGAYPPPGSSEKYTVGDFLKRFKVV